jgi:hypothetical protein
VVVKAFLLPFAALGKRKASNLLLRAGKIDDKEEPTLSKRQDF